jgi:hypothetical protein
MATKIAPFSLTEPDICVKCGGDMAIGSHATWLREPERKGYYHPSCGTLPTIEALTKVKVQAQDSPLGYIWMRVNAIPAQSLLGETTPATRLIPTEVTDGNTTEHVAPESTDRVPAMASQESIRSLFNDPRITAPLPSPWEVKTPAPSADSILVNAIATALLPALGKMVSEAVANGQPRIVVNVYVPKKGDEVKALDILGKELFLLESVQSI